MLLDLNVEQPASVVELVFLIGEKRDCWTKIARPCINSLFVGVDVSAFETYGAPPLTSVGVNYAIDAYDDVPTVAIGEGHNVFAEGSVKFPLEFNMNTLRLLNHAKEFGGDWHSITFFRVSKVSGSRLLAAVNRGRQRVCTVQCGGTGHLCNES